MSTDSTSGTDGTDGTNSTSGINLRIPDELRRRIRVLAAEEDKSAQQWMREALELVVRKSEERRHAE